MCSRKRTLMLCGLIAVGLLAASTGWRHRAMWAGATAGAEEPRTPAQAQSFNPMTTVSPANTEANRASDLVISSEIPEGDVYFSDLIDFFPTAWQITPSSEVGIGVLRDVTDVVVQSGLSNAPCNTQLPISVNLLNATTDKSRTVTFEDGLDDSNSDGFPDFIDMYPDFNDRILGSAQPVQRDAGVADVGGLKVLFQYMTYQPGATIAGRATDPALGAPVVTVLNNTGDPQAIPVPSVVTDVCSPAHWTTVSFATAADGTVLVKNPEQPGTYTFKFLSHGERDGDGDGHENALDPCPLDPDPTWDPRAAEAVGPGDADGDGLPSSCDPDDSKAVDDQDGDGYLNRGDNCPLVANGVNQAGTAAGNQKDTDSDDIGDACDPNPLNADSEGEAPEVLLSRDVTITEAVPPAAAAPATGGGGLLSEHGSGVATWWYALAAGGALLAAVGGWYARRRWHT